MKKFTLITFVFMTVAFCSQAQLKINSSGFIGIGKDGNTEANCCNANLKSTSLATGTTNNLAENIARLVQNIPNPYSKETRIGCFISEGSTMSVLYIYNMNGTQLQQYNITGKGKQTFTISGNSLVPGMYLYALVIDGKEVDTKRMILTK